MGTKPRPIEVQTSHASNAAGVAAGSSTDQSSSIGFTNNLHQASGMSSAWPLSSSVIQQRRRTVGMVVYQATEKDCVGENGEGEAECVICFEEFAVGDELGRLECLCKFHKVSARSSLRSIRLSADEVIAIFRHVYDNGGTPRDREPARSTNSKKKSNSPCHVFCLGYNRGKSLYDLLKRHDTTNRGVRPQGDWRKILDNGIGFVYRH